MFIFKKYKIGCRVIYSEIKHAGMLAILSKSIIKTRGAGRVGKNIGLEQGLLWKRMSVVQSKGIYLGKNIYNSFI